MNPGINKRKKNKGGLIRHDSMGGNHHHNHNAKNYESLTYVRDESDAWRANNATEHFVHRGNFWNAGKHETSMTYILIALVGIHKLLLLTLQTLCRVTLLV